MTYCPTVCVTCAGAGTANPLRESHPIRLHSVRGSVQVSASRCHPLTIVCLLPLTLLFIGGQHYHGLRAVMLKASSVG